jgi:hypothetical protein
MLSLNLVSQKIKKIFSFKLEKQINKKRKDYRDVNAKENIEKLN